MQFIHSEGPAPGITALSERLSSELGGGKKVLWLVCGGSNIVAEAEIMKRLPADLTEHLTVTLTDERYGDIGHKDSNWQQLLDKGFDIKSGQALPMLDGSPLETTISQYGHLLADQLQKSDITLATFGIGGDGHIAGILPDSPAAHENKALAAGYDSPPYTRLTMTFPALKQIDVACALAFGNSKREVLQRLENEDLEPVKQPSQILKQLPETYLYSDQIGGTS
jgi:6-phosphogluconolactonase/glucosamine-6-phosphate isomerase/deaminase